MWRLLYNSIGMPAAGFGLRLASLWDPKVREGIEGRRGEKQHLLGIRNACRPEKKRVLVHCSSAGELESAIPLMEALTAHSDPDLVLSIYSPSARSRADNINGLAGKLYLPFDMTSPTQRLLDILDPSLVVFVKHDVWPNLVWLSREAGIRTALVNGNFRPDSTRLYPVLKRINRAVLSRLDAIYAVAEDDAERFRQVAGNGMTIETAGDTRFDRVRQRALSSHADQGALAEGLKDRPVAVAGSTWPAGEELLLDAWRSLKPDVDDAVLVLAPHEPKPQRLASIAMEVARRGLTSITLSEFEAGKPAADVLVIDRMGVLAGLYGLGRIAYVGGGFGDGVHSVIEPAVFGIPVLYGPKHLMSHEARDLLAGGASLVVHKAVEIETAFRDALTGGDTSRRMGDTAGAYVNARAGVAPVLAEKLTALAEL